MLNFSNQKSAYSNRNPLHQPHHGTSFSLKNNSTQQGGNTPPNLSIIRRIPLQSLNQKNANKIVWPTAKQSNIPDGKFGPAKQIFGDCWFMATLAAIANDQDGKKILAQTINKVTGGHQVTFPGLPNNKITISDADLQKQLSTYGGDADTRILELAADKLFSKNGIFTSLFSTALMKGGASKSQADALVKQFCTHNNIKDPMTYNPMQEGGIPFLAFYLLTGVVQDALLDKDNESAKNKEKIMQFLRKHVTNDPDGPTVVLNGQNNNRLGTSVDKNTLDLSILWDMLRTNITSDKTVDSNEQTFLNTLDKWLQSRSSTNLDALKTAAANLKLDPQYQGTATKFVDVLVKNQPNMQPQHVNNLRSAIKDVQDVRNGGTGHLGFPGLHAGTLLSIDENKNTYTYTEPNNPSLVHTGKLSDLIQAILSGDTELDLTEPKSETQGSIASPMAAFNKAMQDGKITKQEGDAIAKAMGMDPATFWKTYDPNNNKVISGQEADRLKKTLTALAAFDTAMQDGKITKQEGNTIAKAMGMDPKTFWDTYDSNKNNVMTTHEADRLRKQLTGPNPFSPQSPQSPQGSVTPLNTFEKAMQDGKITKQEGDAIAKAMGMNPTVFWLTYDSDDNHIISNYEAVNLGQNMVIDLVKAKSLPPGYSNRSPIEGRNVLDLFMKAIMDDGMITSDEGNAIAQAMGMDTTKFWKTYDLKVDGILTDDEAILLLQDITNAN
jgi:lambda repressor-like predicted transcriptional regulator